MPTPKRVTSLEAAKILTDTSQLRLLKAFFQAEVVLTELATQLGLNLPTLLYKVNKWLELGIIHVIREEPRRGRASKVYRAAAEAFFVPFELTPSPDLSSFLYELVSKEDQRFYDNITRELQRSDSHFGVLVGLGELGNITVQMTTEADILNLDEVTDTSDVDTSPALLSHAGVLRLEFDAAKALEQEMEALLEKYQSLNTTSAQAYAYRLGLTPVIDE